MGAEANNAAGFVKGVAHGEVFAAVGVVPPFRYRGTVYNKIIHRRAVGVHLPGSQTVGVVFILRSFRAGFGGCQLPTVAPIARTETTIYLIYLKLVYHIIYQKNFFNFNEKQLCNWQIELLLSHAFFNGSPA